MHYIFNKNGKLISTCDFEPNTEDLQSREEYFVKSVEDLNHSRLVGGKYGGIYEAVETPEEIVVKETNKVLKQRNIFLSETDWITTRHFEEKMVGKEPTLSESDLSEILNYRQELRDIPTLEGFPFVSLPQQPSFLE